MYVFDNSPLSALFRNYYRKQFPSLACTRFRRHRVKVFNGAGGGHGETAVYARVQGRGGQASEGSRRCSQASRARSKCSRERAAEVGEGVWRRSAAFVSWPRPDEAGTA